jgi:hypothetical protein
MMFRQPAVTIIFGLLPVFTNAYLAYTVFLEPDLITLSGQSYHVIVFASVGSVAAGLIGLVLLGLGSRTGSILFIVQNIILVFVFAGIYRAAGLDDGVPNHLDHNASTALYFSIITWTSVGYGDFSPPPEIRMVAATEAIFGYIFLAVLAGIGSHASRGQ